MYSFCFPLIDLAVGVFLLFPPAEVQHQRVLEAVKCRAEFPKGIQSMSAIYVGEGRIYLFGGYTEAENYTNSIYHFNASADTLERVGKLPDRTFGQALFEDPQGNILHFGGWERRHEMDAIRYERDTIVRFNTTSNMAEVVGRLPKGMDTRGALRHRADSTLVFERNGLILEVNLTTYQVTQVVESDFYRLGVAWDGHDRVLLFRSYYPDQVYSISGNTFTNFTSPENHEFWLHQSVVSTPKSAWIVGNEGDRVGRGNGIFQVDFKTVEFKFWPVKNYPAGYNGTFCRAATTYVPELHRLYMFGGMNISRDFKDLYGGKHSYITMSDIWYIDLPGTEVPSAG